MNTRVLRHGGPGVAAVMAALLSLCVLAVTPIAARAHDGLSSVNGAVHVEGSAPVGDVSTVNGGIQVDPGEQTGKVSTVNGGIRIGAQARVGRVTTVNGRITLGAHVAAESLGTVNGAIDVGPGTHVGGTVSTVNGGLRLDDGADVGGDLSSVNGGMRLTDAHVAGSLRTHSGDIYVGQGSRIDGGIKVYQSGYDFNRWLGWLGLARRHVPRIVIAPGAVVAGTLRFERPVELRVSRQARIGRVEGATAVSF